MPAPKSRLIEERQPFAPVDTANTLFRKVLKISMKMPKRYTYLLLQDLIHQARKVRDNAKAANAVFATNTHEQQIRIDYWIKTRAELQALSSGIDDFLDMPDTLTYKDQNTGKSKGITVKELEEIADLIVQEMRLLTKQLEKERSKFQ